MFRPCSVIILIYIQECINIGKACYISVVLCLSDMFCAGFLRTPFAVTFTYCRHERAGFPVTVSRYYNFIADRSPCQN